MTCVPDATFLALLARRLGPKGFTADPRALAPWLTDWRGRVAGQASALLSPATTDEVADIVRLAAEARVAIVPQGGNTSMVAGAVPPAEGGALLLSLRRMNAIRSVSADDNVAVVEAGVILATLHEAAEQVGRRFPLSLAAKGSATIGGLISTNAGGTQVLRFGAMRALVLGVEAVLPSGDRFDGLSALRKDNRGYDLRQLLVGAEGTLGIVTAASLRLVPAVGRRAVAWIGLDRPADALRLLRQLEEATGEAIETFELLPRVALDLVLAHVPGTRAPLAGSHPWYVLLEATAPAALPDPADSLSGVLAGAIESGAINDTAIAASEAQADALWRLRETVPEAERADGPAVKHDISVPVSATPDFLATAISAVERQFAGTRVFAFGHLGDGNIHFNVRPPEGADRPDWIARHGAAVSCLVHDLVGRQGGSISAEHGIGQIRLAEFARTADPTRLALLRAIKGALDPHGIMNPGKLIPAE
ncbi:FAD-binding oxidoreductase [uncultured Sphingomonas sp.]|uniref:FAD-binding oxidoreductase n=1 Tax=uncultured Sphingomonas sp. TaxID=158754 RepID=UPI0025E03B7E|nr:FAD-binding oxidoreductase [uncultured Sphingomonas sp.]